MRDVWFWQAIISPHIAGLASALARTGHCVTYVAGQEMSEDRRRMGWTAPQMEGVNVLLARDADILAGYSSQADAASIHLCQGLRGNEFIAKAQRSLGRRNLQQWVLMETVTDDGVFGLARRMWYTELFRRHQKRTTGVLAIGHKTANWVAARGMPSARVFPFAYFLDLQSQSPASSDVGAKFRFLFVGQFVGLKRLPLLIDALAGLPHADFELAVVGSGPLEDKWRAHANRMLPNLVRWVGVLPAEHVSRVMADADCLVLPSTHDGWGAVVSEALMAGTPVVCSDSCGAAGVVRASSVGGVFARDDIGEFARLLRTILNQGRQSPERRGALIRWATALGAQAGADYLTQILDSVETNAPHPVEPWLRERYSCVA